MPSVDPKVLQILNGMSKTSYTTSVSGSFHYHDGAKCTSVRHHKTCGGKALAFCVLQKNGVYKCTHILPPKGR